MKTAMLFDIQHFCVHDGPGIRTAVFFKGCPLRCIWCHNPESVGQSRDLVYRSNKCVGCGACGVTCTYGVHSFYNGVHEVDFARCSKCGECPKACCYDAISLVGSEWTLESALKEIMIDLPYYFNGGGVTLTGGEPMLQATFAVEFARALKALHIDVCVETCGYAPQRAFESIAPHVDTFLFDYKATNSAAHENFTGVTNDLILCNLKFLCSLGKKIVLRCPLIPGMNDSEEHLRGIATIANELNIRDVELLPYHSIGEVKRTQMGLSPKVIELPSADVKKHWLESIHALHCPAKIV